jgi:hypothetical protein
LNIVLRCRLERLNGRSDALWHRNPSMLPLALDDEETSHRPLCFHQISALAVMYLLVRLLINIVFTATRLLSLQVPSCNLIKIYRNFRETCLHLLGCYGVCLWEFTQTPEHGSRWFLLSVVSFKQTIRRHAELICSLLLISCSGGVWEAISNEVYHGFLQLLHITACDGSLKYITGQCFLLRASQSSRLPVRAREPELLRTDTRRNSSEARSQPPSHWYMCGAHFLAHHLWFRTQSFGSSLCFNHQLHV